MTQLLALSGIYRIRNLLDGKVYIGSSYKLSRRFATHQKALENGSHYAKHLQAAWNRDGSASFAFEVLLVCEKSDVLFYEQRALDTFQCVDRRFGYNSNPTAKSRAGVKLSAETRAKLSAAHTGKTYDAAYKARMSERLRLSPPNKGKAMSAEQKAKISATRLERGIKVSPEARVKIAEAMRKRRLTPEHKAKIGEASRKRVMSPESRAKLSATRKILFATGALSMQMSAETREKISRAHKARFKNKGE